MRHPKHGLVRGPVRRLPRNRDHDHAPHAADTCLPHSVISQNRPSNFLVELTAGFYPPHRTRAAFSRTRMTPAIGVHRSIPAAYLRPETRNGLFRIDRPSR